MSSAHMQLIVHHGSAGNIVRDHGHRIGAVSARCLCDISPTDQRLRHGRRRIHRFRRSWKFHRLMVKSQRQRKMHFLHAAGTHRYRLPRATESVRDYRHVILAHGHVREQRHAFFIRGAGSLKVRRTAFRLNLCALHRPVLRIVDDGLDGPKY